LALLGASLIVLDAAPGPCGRLGPEREHVHAPLRYNQHLDTRIRNLDERAYRELKARAARLMIVLASSFLVAYHNQRDVHHRAAAATMERLVAGEWGPALLPEYVFLEVVTVLLARRGLDVAVRVATILLQPRDVEFVPSSDMFLDVMEPSAASARAA
jgi:hypothetical protein